MKHISWQAVQRRVRALSARERAAIACLAVVAGMTLASWGWTLDLQRREEALDVRARRQEVAVMLARTSDKAGQDLARRAAAKVRYWSVVEPAVGIAQAYVLGAVQAVAEQAGLENVSVVLDESAPEGGAGTSASISVRLNADFEWASVLALLRSMQSNRLSFTIREMARAPAGAGAATLQLVVSAPYLSGQSPT